jgi:hypothetical protein
MTPYEFIKKQGYVIDVHDVRPTLIKNTRAQKFETWEEALDAALREIADKNPEALRYRNGV